MRSPDRVARALAGFALAAVVAFALACGAVQFLRSDLDPWRAPLSFYLVSDYGALVRGVYYALAAGLVAFGVAAYRTSQPARRSAVPLLLFAIAGIALVPVAASEPLAVGVGAQAAQARFVHGIAAQTTFLCVTVAMVLQSLWWGHDAAFARRRVGRLWLALTALGMLAVSAFARTDGFGGLKQKILIALILAWLGSAAWQTERAVR